ncbi:ABC transporter ATP-binding protein [Cellulomonas sp. URHB0016]
MTGEGAPPALAVRGVTKDFSTGGGTLRVLHGIDLEIGPSSHVAVVGPSGSGKSTLLSIMGTLEDPTTGDVVVGGSSTVTMTDGDKAALRSRAFGFVFQQFHLLEYVDATRNVELGLLYAGFSAKERRERARHALERVGLGGRMDHRPGQLSGGEQQRVAVARAIAHDPQVVFADEPTGALDQATGRSVMELLRGLSSTALVVITHDEAIAGSLPRLVRVRDGRIEQDVHQRAHS